MARSERVERQRFAGATAVIPAAGPVPQGVTTLASVSSPAMLPVGGKPVIHWTIDYLCGLGIDRFRIGVPRRGEPIEDYVRYILPRGCSVEWIVCHRDLSVAHSVVDLCDGVKGPVLIVLGDTLFSLGPAALPFDRPWILTAPVQDPSEWCVVAVDDDGCVSQWFDKDQSAPSRLAAIGVYWLPDAEAAAVGRMATTDSSFANISDLFRVVSPAGVRTFAAGEWLDCGHPQTYDSSRRSVMAARDFNTLVFDDLRGTVRKRSLNTQKLSDEIRYMIDLPHDLKPFFPQIFDWDLDADQPWMEMEYFGYPTLSELFLYHQLHLSTWDSIFERLAQVLVLLRSGQQSINTVDVLAMYLEKTERRISTISSDASVGRFLRHDAISINGVPRLAFPDLWALASEVVRELSARPVGAMIHGDLCFSNVLFDLRTGMCRFIDPRGSFGQPGHLGDQRYDISKIHHSVIGLYDHLVAGLFNLGGSEGNYELEISSTPLQRAIAERYREIVLSSFDESEVDLITGLIFLGLAPLHPESVDRQTAFLLQGTEFVTRGLLGLGAL